MKSLTIPIITVLATAATGFAASPVTASISNPRPLAAAAQVLELKLGMLIDYEDPPYVSTLDVTDVTAAVANPIWAAAHPAAHALVPRTGTLLISLPANADPVAALATLVQQHSQNGNPGSFAVRQRAANSA